jgi:hypothetical protein
LPEHFSKLKEDLVRVLEGQNRLNREVNRLSMLYSRNEMVMRELKTATAEVLENTAEIRQEQASLGEGLPSHGNIQDMMACISHELKEQVNLQSYGALLDYCRNELREGAYTYEALKPELNRIHKGLFQAQLLSRR